MEANQHIQQKTMFNAENLEFNRFGLIVVILLLVGCLGGIAVGLGAIEYLLTLVAVVIPTMMTLSMIIAVAPMRMTIITGLVACAIDIAMIAFFTIF
ncbi:MAG: hypothetical protein V4638_01710 [Bacteroidota bacterium]